MLSPIPTGVTDTTTTRWPSRNISCSFSWGGTPFTATIRRSNDHPAGLVWLGGIALDRLQLHDNCTTWAHKLL